MNPEADINLGTSTGLHCRNLASRLDESSTHHFQLGLAKVLKCSVLIMVRLTKFSEMFSGLVKLNCYKYPCCSEID